MNKKPAYILLLILSIIGSIVCFYFGSFIFGDVANYTYGWNGLNFFVSIPSVMFCFQFVACSVLVLRYYRSEKYRKKTLLLYIRILISFSIIGIIFIFLSSIYSYGTLFAKYPFPYYLIIFLIIHILIIAISIYYYKKIKNNMKEDNESKKMTISYVIYSICLPGYIFFAYYKFGALILSFLYVQLSTLYMTWPAYVWLSVPVLLFYFVVLKDFKYYKDYNEQILHISLCLILDICLSLTFFITSAHNSLFISAISPAFGLDRLATNPYVAIFQFVITVSVYLYYLIRCIYKKIIKEPYND